MSESDINKLPHAQANGVRPLTKEGWVFESYDGSEVMLKKPGYNIWIKENGDTYP